MEVNIFSSGNQHIPVITNFLNVYKQESCWGKLNNIFNQVDVAIDTRLYLTCQISCYFWVSPTAYWMKTHNYEKYSLTCNWRACSSEKNDIFGKCHKHELSNIVAVVVSIETSHSFLLSQSSKFYKTQAGS